ncbi:MAG: PEGA domain-containing protein, partial [Candidatus Eremiobacteraeota bacterium]|nr:PEGA domain-containing protein [Candidatus Eremiobacteraeota bacterium]
AGTPAGGVYITTLPAGADVWIDGTYVGRAPILVDALATGHHALTITRTGWLVQEVDVSVPPGGVVMSSTRLAAGPRAFAVAPAGSVGVRQVTAGASLLLDGTAFNANPGQAVPLAAGPHQIAIVTPKGRATRSFTVLPDTATELVLRTEQSSGGARSAVVAPADDYVGSDAYTIEGQKIVLRTNGHLVVAHFGDTAVRYDGVAIAYDAAPTSIGGKLYLPLALLEKLSDDTSKAH